MSSLIESESIVSSSTGSGPLDQTLNEQRSREFVRSLHRDKLQLDRRSHVCRKVSFENLLVFGYCVGFAGDHVLQQVRGAVTSHGVRNGDKSTVKEGGFQRS